MTVAFDIANYPIFKDGELFYPGIAAVLAIINCGGTAILFTSRGVLSNREKKMIDELARMFNGRLVFGQDNSGADMCVG